LIHHTLLSLFARPPPPQSPPNTHTKHNLHPHKPNLKTKSTQAFFQYGFNLPQDPPDLSRSDQAHFTTDHIYGSLAHEEPINFDGGWRGAVAG